MTVPECRESKNPNHVRCFDKNSLMPHVLNEKWDLIKVTCTQRFNKQVKYGLSFIKVHSADAVSTSASASPLVPVAQSPKQNTSCDEILELPKNNVFSQFIMHSENSSDSDKDEQAASSLFSKWKQSNDSPQKSPANGQRHSCKLFIKIISRVYCCADILSNT